MIQSREPIPEVSFAKVMGARDPMAEARERDVARRFTEISGISVHSPNYWAKADYSLARAELQKMRRLGMDVDRLIKPDPSRSPYVPKGPPLAPCSPPRPR